MDSRVENLRASTAGRYKIFTEETEEGMEIICLDQEYNLVTNRRMSKAQMQNSALMTAVYGDLKLKLGCS
ncbi:hypothetical protein [Pseudomonas sp. CNPSo 3701]|uniref:hypothetical protein n=1 Tax=Pseudomonas sp. CNPSo 3701 TaxID=3027943 RepID=UPI0023646E53|nr:hypothetical protein [Pseudomonas sp. CNPSo 3701]MDD1507704.1 hypothetical protein [Pseudomonas sp. CNPSo 3701]